jgi:hypothetical protein
MQADADADADLWYMVDSSDVVDSRWRGASEETRISPDVRSFSALLDPFFFLATFPINFRTEMHVP